MLLNCAGPVAIIATKQVKQAIKKVIAAADVGEDKYFPSAAFKAARMGMPIPAISIIEA